MKIFVSVCGGREKPTKTDKIVSVFRHKTDMGFVGAHPRRSYWVIVIQYFQGSTWLLRCLPLHLLRSYAARRCSGAIVAKWNSGFCHALLHPGFFFNFKSWLTIDLDSPWNDSSNRKFGKFWKDKNNEGGRKSRRSRTADDHGSSTYAGERSTYARHARRTSMTINFI